MAGTPKTGETAISLPKGGGALVGIGEKYSPDLFTGTGNFTIPIDLLPGRNGFQPELTLVYSTGNGNGNFGLGWRLNVPGVSRKTSDGVPLYNEEAQDPATTARRDIFILSGAEDLVPVAGIYPDVVTYRPRTEGLFARITHRRSSGPQPNSFWQVESKDGLVSLYGTREPIGNDPATLTHPDDPTRIFAWKLTETQDPFGNLIRYYYDRDAGNRDGRMWDQPLLKRIAYADYDDPKRGAKRFLVTVDLDYEARPDSFSDYRAGFEIRTSRRCKAIRITTHTADGETHPVREYRFTYDADSFNGVSLLRQVDVIGFDDDGKPYDDEDPNGAYPRQLPPLTFDYTRFEPAKRRFKSVAGPELPGRGLGSPDMALVDLHGGGLPDFFEMNGAARYWRNLGQGQFDKPRLMPETPPHSLADAGVQMIDADGDGRMDLLVTSGPLAGYYPLKQNAHWSQSSFQRYAGPPSIPLDDPQVKLVDLSGDGRTDVLYAGSRLTAFFNDPDPAKAWQRMSVAARRSLAIFPNVNFADPRVRLADMTGDGLQDIVLIHDGNVEYWPNLGHNRWGNRLAMRSAPRFPAGYDPQRVLLGDVDGDGLADIVYVDHDRVLLWPNQSGNGWRPEPVVIKGTPAVSSGDDVRLVDLHGTGVSGLLWSSDTALYGRPRLMFLDFTGGEKPYLLNEMDNHVGAVTRIAYASSTAYFLADQKRPETRWRTPLPFPVQVVARVEVIDQISQGKLTTAYRYHHGYWDGAEREFRGFGMVEQLDSESFEHYHSAGLHGDEESFRNVPKEQFTPPTLTKTWFHQGPVGKEFGDWSETDYTLEYWQGDPQLLGHTEQVNAFLQAYNDRGEDRAPSPRNRRIKRDALRTLRGSVLRSELYALDGSSRQDRPYAVTEHSYALREVDASATETERKRIFFPYVVAQRTTQWERGADPLTQFNFTGDYDRYGQPRVQTLIACPRGWRTLADRPAEIDHPDPNHPQAMRRFLATRARSAYAQRDDAQVYIADRVVRTTSYEIENDGSQTLLEMLELPDSSPALQIIGQTLNYYDGGPFEGLPLGRLGDYGALVRSESLALTEEIVNEAYKSSQDALAPPEKPPYLVSGVSPPWTADYPQPFRAALAVLAGYTFYPGDADHARGYFVTAARQRYDFHDDPAGKGRGLRNVTRDPLGRDTTIDYDAYALLPTLVTDPAGLTVQAAYNYRLLQPQQVIDPNENWQRFGFTPLGLAAWHAVIDKAGQGDTEQMPGARFQYDFLAFMNSLSGERQPISVRTIRREHHANEPDVSPQEKDNTIETIEYSDGFGRLLQTRTQAEDLRFGDGVVTADQSDLAGAMADVAGVRRAPDDPSNVVVSGWQTYNNKGWVVEKYEPFFDQGWTFNVPGDAQLGQKATMFYDPRGQVIRTVNPDGAERRVIYGVPGALTDPDSFDPTPWEAYTYDANDLASVSVGPDGNSLANRAPSSHLFTPASIEIDALGRAVKAVERNGGDPLHDWYTTRSSYDIRDNLLTVTDPLDRVAFRYVYDLGGNPLRIDSIDAGLRRLVLDAAGQEVERRDSKGALILQAYDILNRPTRMWARDDAAGDVTLRERILYGDSPDAGMTTADARARNLLGQRYQHYDEAGRLVFEEYDFKGNLLEKVRQAIDDAQILAVFDGAPANNWQVDVYRVEWTPPSGTTLSQRAAELLDPAEFATSFSYDALNRVKALLYPRDVDGQRKMLRPRYNRAGALQQVTLESDTYVEHIAYNARGQRILIAYGNQVMTRYAYDPLTFRLQRLHTGGYVIPTEDTYRPQGATLQDFAYVYDLAGNITGMRDKAPGCGLPAQPDQLDRAFTYDAIYRLLTATGREQAAPPPAAPWLDTPKTHDLTEARVYREQYAYDRAGNVLHMQHSADSGSFTRHFTLDPNPDPAQTAPLNNRLQAVTIGNGQSTNYDYRYDLNGNLVAETTSRHFEWDHGDRLKAFRIQVSGAEPSLHAHYLYDASGQRVKKWVRNQQGQVTTTVFVDGLFEQHTVTTAIEKKVNNTLHVMDDQSRIALVRVGPALDDKDASPRVQYHLGDHLGSSHVVVGGDDSATNEFINREEYFPYGETSFGSFGRKRYRYSGKERDEESGLCYFGARFLAPWLASWMNCDPIMQIFPCNQYHYSSGNPISKVDRDGRQVSDLPDNTSELDETPIDPVSLYPVIGPTRDAKESFSLAIDAYFEGDKAMMVSHGLMGISNTLFAVTDVLTLGAVSGARIAVKATTTPIFRIEATHAARQQAQTAQRATRPGFTGKPALRNDPYSPTIVNKRIADKPASKSAEVFENTPPKDYMVKANRDVLDKKATELGYELVKGRKSNGQPIYVRRSGKGPKYISPDVGSGMDTGGSHRGGSWKGADSIPKFGSKRTRSGSYDFELNRIAD